MSTFTTYSVRSVRSSAEYGGVERLAAAIALRLLRWSNRRLVVPQPDHERQALLLANEGTRLVQVYRSPLSY